jgi:2-polyprenyl-6-methoxyphenol hydroxylase-like FAD-dependent oxidoreductase
VIGADGRGSHVAKAVDANSYHERPRLQWSFYTYFSELPVDGFEIFIRPLRGFAAAPTNDGLTMLVLGWPYAEARSFKADVEGNFFRTLQLAPQFAARVRSARREAPFLGGAVPNYLRVPFGPGWALVGCRLQQGPDHRTRDHRRLPRRRTVFDSGRPLAQRPVVV